MKKTAIFCAIFLSLCLASAAFGQKTEIPAEKRKIIAEIITVTKADKNVEDVMTAMMGQMNQVYPQLLQSSLSSRDDLTPEQKTEIEKGLAEKQQTFFLRFQEKLKKSMNYQEFIDATFYPLYDKFFTESELRDILAFYKTPTGQKLNSSLPQFSAESLKLSQEYLVPKLQVIILEMVKEDTEKSIAPTAKPDN